MTPTSRAAQVARGMANFMDEEFTGGQHWEQRIQYIAAALESYAEEQVKEAINMSYQGGLIWKDYIENEAQELADEQNEKHYLEGRAEALEEAAKIADEKGKDERNLDPMAQFTAISIAGRIRALTRPIDGE